MGFEGVRKRASVSHTEGRWFSAFTSLPLPAPLDAEHLIGIIASMPRAKQSYLSLCHCEFRLSGTKQSQFLIDFNNNLMNKFHC